MDESALLFDHLGSSHRFEHIELRRLTVDRTRAFARVEEVDELPSDDFGCIDLPVPIEHPFAPSAPLDFVLVLPRAFRIDSIAALYVKIVARRNRLRYFLAQPPGEEEGGENIVAHERATLTRWIAVLFHNTRGVAEDFSPSARVGLLDKLGASNEAIVERLVAFDQATGANPSTDLETRNTLAALGFEIISTTPAAIVTTLSEVPSPR